MLSFEIFNIYKYRQIIEITFSNWEERVRGRKIKTVKKWGKQWKEHSDRACVRKC